VAARVRASWTAWRGTAIEPVIRESVRRVGDQLPGHPQVIGSYWTRTNDPQVDLIGADRERSFTVTDGQRKKHRLPA
jgi:hypothetical protein